tara:strand:- start:569 stop:685 length:117 start_codon:yes stop_codon:yes gene_type:complete
MLMNQIKDLGSKISNPKIATGPDIGTFNELLLSIIIGI